MLKDVTTGVKSNKTIYTIVIIFVVIVIALVIKKLYDASKIAGNAAGQILGDKIIADKLKLPVDRVRYIRSKGADLWVNGVHSIFWVRDYNEEMFIKAVNEMQYYVELSLLEESYKELSGHDISFVIKESFDSNDKKKLNAKWLKYLIP